MRFERIAAVLAVVLLVPTLGWSQDSNSATIAGVVRDASGAVLPGVTVEAASPALIEKVRIATTDSDGRFRIIELRPGEYVVTFTLPGFRTLRRDGHPADDRVHRHRQRRSVGRRRRGDGHRDGAAPIVDVQGVQEQQVFSGETVRALPIGKNSGIYVDAHPGGDAGQPGEPGRRRHQGRIDAELLGARRARRTKRRSFATASTSASTSATPPTGRRASTAPPCRKSACRRRAV